MGGVQDQGLASPGVGFSFNDYDNDNTNSNVSSHLCEIKNAQTLPTGQKTSSHNTCGQQIRGFGSYGEKDPSNSKE